MRSPLRFLLSPWRECAHCRHSFGAVAFQAPLSFGGPTFTATGVCTFTVNYEPRQVSK